MSSSPELSLAPRLSSTPLAAAGAALGCHAARDAATQALSELGGDPSLVLLFPDGALDAQAAIDQVRELTGGVPLAGMTANGEISADGAMSGGCSVLAFGAGIKARVGTIERASHDPRAAGRDAASAALQGLVAEDGHHLLMLFLDTRSGDQSEMVAGAYGAAGAEVPLVGGAAGGRDPAELAGANAGRDRVVAVGLVADAPVGVGIAHGCSRLAVPAIVTRAEGRVIRQLDGRPAEEVYLEKLGRAGERLSDGEFEELAVVHPLAQPEMRGGVRLRHVLGRVSGGGLACATHIPANAAIEFTRQTADAIVTSTFDAVSEAIAPLGGPARAALVFDCAGRRRALGGPGAQLDAEVEALVSSFGQVRPALAGLYTHGEIGRVRGAKGDRNHAVVVAAFA